MRPGELMGRIVGASAGVIAVAALATAVYTAWITREQQKMSVWPYVTQMSSDSGGAYNYLVRNAGLGPALVRSFELRVDGRPARDWSDVVHRAGWKAQPRGALHSDLGRGWVLLPGQTVSIYMVPDSADRFRFRREVLPRLETIVCYCSLYGDCWRYNSNATEPEQATCPETR